VSHRRVADCWNVAERENAVDERPEPGSEKARGVGDLPYVDGSAATPEELRAEVARASDPQVRAIEEVREDVAATLDELSSRFDVRRQVAQHVPRAWPVVIAVGALLAAVVVWRRRSSRRLGD
jgi:hypothetical protein